MDKGFKKVKDGQLYCEIIGDGEDLVFLHGFSLDHTMWKPQVSHFSQKYRVITYDMRGFGLSSKPVSKYSHHEDLKALLDKLDVKSCNLVGLSLGGEVGIDFTLEYPGVVDSLTLLDSSLAGYTSRNNAIKVDWDVQAMEQGVEQGKKNWINHAVFSTIKNSDTNRNLLSDMVNNYSGWHWINQDPRKKIMPFAIDRLDEIKVPIMICVGEKDLNYFKTVANIIHENINGSEFNIVPNSGHMVNIENPVYVNKLIEDFLQRLHVK